MENKFFKDIQKSFFYKTPLFDQPVPFFGQNCLIFLLSKRDLFEERVERHGRESHICTRKVLSTQCGCTYRKNKTVKNTSFGGRPGDLVQSPAPVLGMCSWHGRDLENVHLFLGEPLGPK